MNIFNNRKLNLLVATVLVSTTIISCAPKSKPHYKLGKPYSVEGVQYVPKLQPDYKEEGLASWYGDSFHNQLTANGELFNKTQFSAAHKTLPLPSVVTVTNLENGRKVDVRVNDRGPFVKGRIIDVSEAAAKKLGFYAQGSAKVKVEFNKEESLKALDSITISLADRELISSQYKNQQGSTTQESAKSSSNPVGSSQQGSSQATQATEQPTTTSNSKASQPSQGANSSWTPVAVAQEKATPKSLRVAEALAKRNVAATPKVTPTENKTPEINRSKASGSYFVQIVALSIKSEAETLLVKLDGIENKFVEETAVNGNKLYRVRVGGFENESQAKDALNQLNSKGYKDAYITR